LWRRKTGNIVISLSIQWIVKNSEPLKIVFSLPSLAGIFNPARNARSRTPQACAHKP